MKYHFFVISARAAELQPVSPPTDWTGIAIVCAVCFLIVAAVGYIVHIKRTPGTQLGEEFADMVAAKLALKRETGTVLWQTDLPPPLIFDGINFADQSKLDEYKAAKAIVDSHKGGTA